MPRLPAGTTGLTGRGRSSIRSAFSAMFCRAATDTGRKKKLYIGRSKLLGILASLMTAMGCAHARTAAAPQPQPQPQIFYQIFFRSFRDSNGDRIGDLAGLTSRLGYIRQLGA